VIQIKQAARRVKTWATNDDNDEPALQLEVHELNLKVPIEWRVCPGHTLAYLFPRLAHPACAKS